MSNADNIMYQAGRDAHRDGAPAPGEYCVEGDAYRGGWYDADEDADLREALVAVVRNATATMGEDSSGWAYARIRQATLNVARTALGLPTVDEGSAARP